MSEIPGMAARTNLVFLRAFVAKSSGIATSESLSHDLCMAYSACMIDANPHVGLPSSRLLHWVVGQPRITVMKRRTSRVRQRALRKIAFSFANASSIGLKSGLYFGRNQSCAPTASIARRTARLLWHERLSVGVRSSV